MEFFGKIRWFYIDILLFFFYLTKFMIDKEKMRSSCKIVDFDSCKYVHWTLQRFLVFRKQQVLLKLLCESGFCLKTEYERSICLSRDFSSVSCNNRKIRFFFLLRKRKKNIYCSTMTISFCILKWHKEVASILFQESYSVSTDSF